MCTTLIMNVSTTRNKMTPVDYENYLNSQCQMVNIQNMEIEQEKYDKMMEKAGRLKDVKSERLSLVPFTQEKLELWLK